MPLKTKPWNIFDHLRSEEDIAGYLEASFELVLDEGAPAEYLLTAIDDAIEARKKLALSQDIPEVSFSKSAPTIQDIANVLKHFHLKLAVVPG